MVRGVAPVHPSSIFNCLDLSPTYSVMGWWTRADSAQSLFANAWHIGTSQQEWWQTPTFSAQCAAQHRMKYRPWPDSWANQLMSVWGDITRNCGTVLHAQRLRRAQIFCPETARVLWWRRFDKCFKCNIFQQRGAVPCKAWCLHRTALYHSDELLLRGMHPSANKEASPVSTKTSYFSERINAAHVLKLQPPRHHILLIFVSLIQAAFSTVFYEDIGFHIKILECFPSAYWLRWPT